MPKIDLEKYPKIGQTDPIYGCIPVNIENALKYFDEQNYNEEILLRFYRENHIPLSFDQALPHLKRLIPHFEFIFKRKEDFEHSADKMVEYIKKNIDNEIPVLVSFEQSGEAHIMTSIEYNETELIFFDPGDTQKKRFNYLTDQFANALRADFHTLIVRPRD